MLLWLVVLLAVQALARPFSPVRPEQSLADPFRPPAVPLLTFAPMQQKFLFTEQAANASVRYWTGDLMGLNIFVRLQAFNETFQLIGNASLSADLPPLGRVNQTWLPEALATTTKFWFRLTTGQGGYQYDVELAFVNTLSTQDLDLLATPIGYILASVVGVTQNGTVAPASTFLLYVDMDSKNCLHLRKPGAVTWSSAPHVGAQATTIRMGSSAEPQGVLESFGDWWMLDWGYMYLSTPNSAPVPVQLSAGRGDAVRRSFAQWGTLPAIDTANRPAKTMWNDTDPPVVAVVASGLTTGGGDLNDNATAAVFFGYDDVRVQFYYNFTFRALWKERFGNVTDDVSMYMAMDEAAQHWAARAADCDALDSTLFAEFESALGLHYARIASMAYRQTLASVQLVARNDSATVNSGGSYWAFLKEISSGGDINTMDVIFPASPHFLYFAPELLKRLLLPVLNFAAGHTDRPYPFTYSPHQLGFYPISNATYFNQEPMPLEETANMFLMLLGYVQQTNGTDLFFSTYYPMMKTWAWWLAETQLPVPPLQLCTDDFTGPMVGNANLAAKGVVGLHAFAQLCKVMEDSGCLEFELLASQFAIQWLQMTSTSYPRPHTKLALNSTSETWATKYNLVWQKLLGFGNAPFPNFETLLDDELSWYESQASTYGWPLDDRFPFQKVDWMTWASSFANTTSRFERNFDRLYRMFNETESRIPLTDLFFVKTGKDCYSFRSRAVVGALFAPMMLYAD